MSDLYEILKTLDEAALVLAKAELNEKEPKQIADDIEYIRNWIQKQSYMKSRTDDEFLLSFLRAAKYSYSRVQETLKNFWTNRTEIKEYFSGRDLSEDSVLMELADTAFFVPLPELDEQGRIVLIERMAAWDPQKHDYNDLMKYLLICMDVLCENPRVQINGVVTIMDVSGCTASHITECTPGRMQKTTKCLQDMYPFRFKTLNYYNYPKIFDAFFPTFKLFLKEKIKNRLVMHGSDLTSIHKVIPKSILPEEYGGTAGKLKDVNQLWVNHILSRKKMLLEMETYGVDLSKLPKKQTSVNTFTENSTSTNGTFRKLNVD